MHPYRQAIQDRVPASYLKLTPDYAKEHEEFMYQYLLYAAERCSGNVSRLAEVTGYNRNTIARLYKRHGIDLKDIRERFR